MIELSDGIVPQFSVRFSVAMATSVHYVIYTTKVFRQNKRQCDDTEELGDSKVGLVSICFVTINQSEKANRACRLPLPWKVIALPLFETQMTWEMRSCKRFSFCYIESDNLPQEDESP